MSNQRPTRKSYSEAMNEWASREGRSSFVDRSRVSTFTPDPFAHPVLRLLGYLWRLMLVALVGLTVYWLMLRSHLGSKEFAARLAGYAQSVIGADSAVLAPLQWSGADALSRHFTATGGDGAAFRTLEIKDVSFRVPFSMYWQSEWPLRRLEASALEVEFRSGSLHGKEPADEAGADQEVPEGFEPPVVTAPGENISLDVTAPDPGLAPESKGRDSRVLDLKLRQDGLSARPKVQSLSVSGLQATRFGAGWGVSDSTRGELRDGSLSATRGADGSWGIEIGSATFRQNWLRDIKVPTLRARYADGVLALEDAAVLVAGVPATLGGQVRCSEVPEFALSLQGDGLPLHLLCGEPFDTIFNLNTSGTLAIAGSTNRQSGITVAANLRATSGFVRGLAIQHALSTATTRIRFREFEITGGTLEFATGNGRLHVKSFTLESRADVILRGQFIHENDQFTGELEIGVDPVLLQKLDPSVITQFFPLDQSGKRWMSVPLEGGPDKLTSAEARAFTSAHQAAGK